jgi:GntR family transcriptional regulator
MNLGTFDDGSPIYRQIAEQIKADVLDGTLGPDAQLMSTNQYAAYYRINPATAAKAFQQLVDEGVVYKKRGIGMFVSAEARARLQQQHRKRFFSDVVDPMIERARAIGIPLDDVVTRIEQRKDKERRP